MTKQRTAAKKPVARPWWLGGGDEECPHCGRAYSVEAEHRCEACDAPSCMHCIVRQGKGLFCSACLPSESQPS